MIHDGGLALYEPPDRSSCSGSELNGYARKVMTNLDREITGWVEQTPFVDTHEHLIEESMRTSGVLHSYFLPCNDWAYLFRDYVADDLVLAVMLVFELQRFFMPDLSSEANIGLSHPIGTEFATPAMPRFCAIRSVASTVKMI